MSHSTPKGSVVPDSGDDLLGAWPAYDASVGTVIATDTVAQARDILTEMETGGNVPSSAHPVYFDIRSQFYRSVGLKGANGVWDLKMMNEPEFQENSVAPNTVVSGAAGTVQDLIVSSLQMQPYRRTVLVWAMVNASVQGTAGLKLVIQGVDGQSSRWETDSSMTTQTAMNMMSVEANTAPNIKAQISFGGAGKSTVTCGSKANDIKLGVIAWPVSML